MILIDLSHLNKPLLIELFKLETLNILYQFKKKILLKELKKLVMQQPMMEQKSMMDQSMMEQLSMMEQWSMMEHQLVAEEDLKEK